MDDNTEQFAGESSAPVESEQHLQYAPGEDDHQEEPYAEQTYIPQETVQYETLQAVPTKDLKVKRPIAAKKKPPMHVPDLTNGMFRDTGAIPPAKFATMKDMTEDFWVRRKRKMEAITEEEMSTKSKNMSVPMARVKKIMRIDEEVRNFNIASDAPIFMAQAAEFFIEEMTAMAWQHVSEARRRILLKSDVGTAVQKNDQFDFLIDFLPAKAPASNRPTPAANRKNPNSVQATPKPTPRRSVSGEPPQATAMMSEDFQPEHAETQSEPPSDNGYQTVSPTSMNGSSTSMTGPSTSMAGPSTSMAGPSTFMAGPSTSSACTPPSMPGPSTSIAGPSTPMSGSSTATAGPSTPTASTSDHQFAAPVAYTRSHESSGSPSN